MQDKLDCWRSELNQNKDSLSKAQGWAGGTVNLFYSEFLNEEYSNFGWIKCKN